MASTDPGVRTDPVSNRLRRAWTLLRPPPVPDLPPAPAMDPDLAWRLRLERVRAMLELAREVLARDGFTRGSWFTVRTATGGTRLAGYPAALSLRDPSQQVVSACLVGTLVRLADDPDSAPSLADAWACVDELYEAMHERMGHASMPAGRVYAPPERRSRLQGLTAWNDAPGRTRADVLDLVDRAVSRTIVAACH